jgi:4,5-dihydroxyphthalate decarboxylase
MAKHKITLTCGNYEVTNPIIRGAVSLPEFDLRVEEGTNVAAMFTKMFKGDTDVSEMSLAELIYYRSRGKEEFIGIPIFTVRCFRHGFILCDESIAKPEDLNGKNIGFMRWVQTAAIWMRGLLVEEYGISPKDKGWHVASLHHWDDGESDDIIPRDGSVIRRIENLNGDAFQSAYASLLKGEINALGSTKHSTPLLDKGKGIRRLFDDYATVEALYFEKTKIIPIMHVMVIRTDVIRQYPDLPRKMFDLFTESKRLGTQWLKSAPSSVLAWKDNYVDKENEVFGKDNPWAYGLDSNRHVLNKFLSYCHDQGINDRQIGCDELFDSSTHHLIDPRDDAR